MGISPPKDHFKEREKKNVTFNVVFVGSAGYIRSQMGIYLVTCESFYACLRAY